MAQRVTANLSELQGKSYACAIAACTGANDDENLEDAIDDINGLMTDGEFVQIRQQFALKRKPD